MGLDSKSGPWLGRAARAFVLVAGDLLGLNALFRRLNAQRVRVLNYHGVVRDDLPASLWTQLAEAKFRRQMAYLRKRYRVLPASRVDWRAEGPPHRVAITFDDGLANNLHIAAPILEEAGLSAICFVAPGLIAQEPGETIWPDRLYEVFLNPQVREVDLAPWGLETVTLPASPEGRVALLDATLQRIKQLPDARRRDLVDCVTRDCPPRVSPAQSPLRLLTRDELARLARSAAFEIGLHSHTHPIMSKLSPQEQEREVAAGVEALDGLGVPRTAIFAYPNGRPDDFNDDTIGALRRHGMDVAMTTVSGHYDPKRGDPMRVERIMIGNDVTWWEFKAILSGYHYALKSAARWVASKLGG